MSAPYPMNAWVMDIPTAQGVLRSLGYYRGPVDGAFGMFLHQAILAFQGISGLPLTGRLDPLTSQALSSAASGINPGTAPVHIPTPQELYAAATTSGMGEWGILDFLKEVARVIKGSFGRLPPEDRYYAPPPPPAPIRVPLHMLAALNPAGVPVPVPPPHATGYMDESGAFHPITWATATAWPWMAAHPLPLLGGAAVAAYGGYRAWRSRHPSAPEVPEMGPGDVPPSAPSDTPPGGQAPPPSTPVPVQHFEATDQPPPPDQDNPSMLLLSQLENGYPYAWETVRGWRARAGYDPRAHAILARLRAVRAWRARAAMMHGHPGRPGYYGHPAYGRPAYGRPALPHPGPQHPAWRMPGHAPAPAFHAPIRGPRPWGR